VTCTHLTGRLRDFQPNTHPDFEPHMTKPTASGFYTEVETGIVQSLVDSTTWKPIYAGGPSGTNTTIGPEYFPSWYIDAPSVNLGVDYALALTPLNGLTYFSRTPFFPIDDGSNCPVQPQIPCLLGNSTNYPSHNYAMTFELHVHFQYVPDGGQFVEFAGDDDTWLFVNGRLAMDLGGIHQQTVARVQFDTLNLTAGRTRLDFFWAERHVTSSNFDIRTNVDFLDCGVPAPE
jgi:fibro-slime domain-containing protein